jgi:hypothetical protein
MSGGVEPVGYGVCAELASVDHTDARKATVRRFGRSHRRAQHSRFRNPFSVLRYGHPVATGQETSLSPVARSSSGQNEHISRDSATSAEVNRRLGTHGSLDDSGL